MSSIGRAPGRLRVIHFGSGGGKGVTRVITDLGRGHAASDRFEPLIVYRRKRDRPVADAFRQDLAASGVEYREVSGGSRSATIAELRTILREFRPDAFVAHGYSEHLWGRMAALAEDVPIVIHVEHNHERYKWLHLRRARRLAKRTHAIVAVSQAVAQRLRELGMPAGRLQVIYNGVRLDRFAGDRPEPLALREPAVLMVARFGSQKDPATLIRAAALLRDRGRALPVRIAGGGRKLHEWFARRLVRRLGVADQVELLGQRRDVPELLAHSRIFVLSTRFEGLPLALIEAMAAGCAVIGSRVPGVEELIRHGETGWLAAARDPVALAQAIEAALQPEAEGCAAAARHYALRDFALERMTADYEQLLLRLWQAGRPAPVRAGGQP